MATRNTFQVATYLPLEVATQLKAVAERNKWSMAATMKLCVVEYLQRELAKSAELEQA